MAREVGTRQALSDNAIANVARGRGRRTDVSREDGRAGPVAGEGAPVSQSLRGGEGRRHEGWAGGGETRAAVDVRRKKLARKEEASRVQPDARWAERRSEGRGRTGDGGGREETALSPRLTCRSLALAC